MGLTCRKKDVIEVVQLDGCKNAISQLLAVTGDVNKDVIAVMNVPNMCLDMTRVLEYYNKKECDILLSLQRRANFKPDKNSVCFALSSLQ